MTIDGITIFIIFEKKSRLFPIFCYPAHLMINKIQITKQQPPTSHISGANHQSLHISNMNTEHSRSYAHNPSKHSPIIEHSKTYQT